MIALGLSLLIAGSCSSGDSEPTTDISDLLPAPTSTATSTATTTAAATLTDAAREWCRLGEATEADAARFDLIFEAGLSLRLNMDAINATAAGKRFEYEQAGMSPDEAVRAVYEDLLELPSFVAACQEAFEVYGDG